MCDICSTRKAGIALFLGEHAPQIGIRSERAQIAWGELNVLAIELAKLPENSGEQLHAAHQGISARAQKIMADLTLAELEEVHYAGGLVALTGNLHRSEASAVIKARWRAGERDERLSPEAVSSIESSIAKEDANNKLQQQILGAIAQEFGTQAEPPVSMFVPGSKPVPPA